MTGDDKLKVDNMSNSQYVYNLLKKDLNVSDVRGKVISNNIANINTKNYKAYSVSFEDSLKQKNDEFQMKTNDERHITGSSSQFGEMKVERENNYSMKEDGNDVDIESEETKQAENSLDYYAVVSQLNNRYSSTNYIINGR